MNIDQQSSVTIMKIFLISRINTLDSIIIHMIMKSVYIYI